MKRQIIKIDEEKCTGCGLCIPNCPEGALQIIDGKARVVNESLCDGLGACIGHCPEGAIEIEEKESEPYNEEQVMKNLINQGENVVKAHLEHLKAHYQEEYLKQALKFLTENNMEIDMNDSNDKNEKGKLPCGCPGTMAIDKRNQKHTTEVASIDKKIDSELRQWPIQMTLLNPSAPYFQDADLLIAADCTAFSFGNFHKKFLKDKTLIIFCPKLDTDLGMYVEKLTSIIKNNNIKSITITKMEVPCCSGVSRITEEAVKKSGKNLIIKEYTISLDGELI